MLLISTSSAGGVTTRAAQWMLALAAMVAVHAGLVGCARDTQAEADADHQSANPPTLGKTNIVFITACSLSQSKMGTFGQVQDFTPALDDLARDGYSLQWAVTPSIDTFGAVAGLMTGSAPRWLGGGQASQPWVGPLAGEDLSYLPRILHTHGYKTLGICPHPGLAKGSGLESGYDAYQDLSDFPADRKVLGAEVNQRFFLWLQEQKPSAFFAHLVYVDCLAPYISRIPSDVKRDGRKRTKDIAYYDSYNLQVEYVDEQISRLVRTLEGEGYGDLLLFVTADHGRRDDKLIKAAGRNAIVNDTLWVPWVLWHRGLNPAWSRYYELAGSADIFPTLTGLFGLSLPANDRLQGTSRLPDLRDERDAIGAVQVAWSGTDRPAAVYAGIWKLVVEPTAWSALGDSDAPASPRAMRLKLKAPLDAKECRLYRYRLDPLDQKDVLAKHAKQAEAIYLGLGTWFAASGPADVKVVGSADELSGRFGGAIDEDELVKDADEVELDDEPEEE